MRWQQAEGKRHALDAPFAPRPGEAFRAICGATVTPGKRDFVELGGKWLDGTCWDCDAVWREIAGMAPNPLGQRSERAVQGLIGRESVVGSTPGGRRKP